jgi:hypothetical protein
MIITRLIGGLGNQMFQYAAGRRLAHHHNTDLFLDVTGFASYALRKYELDIFRINATIAPSDLLKHVSFSRKDAVRFGIRNLFTGESAVQYIKEKSPDFQEEILSLPDNVYLDGYWQSEKYFAEIADIISQEFSIINPPSIINQQLMEEIDKCNSVSVHIRRGDYVTNPETRRIHYVCDEDYYLRAIAKMMECVEYPSFFIFSDDPEWAQRHIIPDAPVKDISHNPPNPSHEDLRLMMQCHHHIIANSSFSWWGAWLGKKPGQIVIAPTNWFAVEMYSSKDKIPNHWLKI